MTWEYLLKNRNKLIGLSNYDIGEMKFTDIELMLSDLYDEAYENSEHRITGSINRDGTDKRVESKDILTGEFTDSEITPKKINKIITDLQNIEGEIRKLRDALI